jgi:membrane associated rhomboid family serine protease
MSYEQYRPTGFSMLPVVVKNLLIINGLFFLASVGLEKAGVVDLNDLLGMHYFASPLFKPYQIITYMFMHADIWHLVFNMFALWMFGSVMENVWGPKKFIIFYFVCGIGAILIQMLVTYFSIMNIQHAIDLYMASPSPEIFQKIVKGHFLGSLDQESQKQILNFMDDYFKSPQNIFLIHQSNNTLNQMMRLYLDVPTIGASGAVFGILLAFGITFPNTLLYVYFAIPVKAKWVVIFYGALELGFGVYNGQGDNVAHFAHLGGMLFGFILIMIWRRKDKNRNLYEP